MVWCVLRSTRVGIRHVLLPDACVLVQTDHHILTCQIGGILLHFLPKTHLKGQISEIRKHFPSGQPPTKPMGVLESLGHG